jgi:DNA-binding CsgD family transcriptional regulator/tetratricopeptide (TPR) repeat protein
VSTPTRRLLVGRDAERRRLEALLADVATHGAAVVVVGAAGVGKSSLVAAVAFAGAAREMTVLKTTGVQSEARLPFAGLGQLLRPVLAGVDQLPESQRNAILGAVGQIDVEVGDFFAVALATLSLLRDQASKTPVLVVAEDLQWLDRPTVDVLAFVARRIELDPIVMIATSRDSPTGALAEGSFEEVALSGLEEDAAGAVIDTHGPRLRPDLRRRLLDEAAGNPLALVELAAAWSLLPPTTWLDALVPVTKRIEEAFAARLHALPPTCKMVLLVAALDDDDSVAEILAAVGPVAGLADIAPAIEARLVDLDGRSLRFRHPLVRSVVYHAAPVTERHRAHAALAQVLDPDRAIWHQAASALLPDEGIAARLEHAATLARRRGTLLSAVATLERAADLSPADAERGRRLLAAAKLAFELGRREHAEALIKEAEALPLDDACRLQATWQRLRLEGGDWHEVTHIAAGVDVVQRMIAAGEPDMALEALMAICETGLMSFGKPHARLVFAATQQLSAPVDDPRLLFVLACCAPIEFNERLMAQITARPAALAYEPRDLSLVAVAASHRGSWAASAAMLDATIDPLRDQGRLLLLRYVLVTRAFAAWHLGEWDVATYMAGQASRLAEQTEIAVDAGATLALSIVSAVRGNTQAAEAVAIGTEQWARTNHVSGTLRLALFMRGCSALADGRFDEAYDHLGEVFAGDLTHELVMNQGMLSFFFDAAVQSGHHDHARDLLGDLQALPPGSDSPQLLAAIAYAQALLAEDPAADAAFVAASGATAPLPFLHARLLLAHGVWLRRQRRSLEARGPLRAARDALDTLGAAPWGERARQELRATGEKSRQPVPRSTDQLTPQEIEIVQLAAQGLTNREIGQQLYLSHRTVGSHLYRIFPKLNITSRRELADALSHLPAAAQTGEPQRAGATADVR